MKILLLIDSLTSGGMERRLVELIKGLRKRSDVELSLVVFSTRIYYREVFDMDIPVTVLERKPKRNPKVFFRFYKLCKQWSPDIIHSWGIMSAIFAIPPSQLLRIPFVNGYVVDAPKKMEWYDRRWVRARLSFPFSTVIIGNSEAGLEAYKVPKDKGVCIYNGFDINRLSGLESTSAVKQRWNLKTKHVVGMVGSFSYRKDYSTFIHAALKVLQQRDDTTFIAVGDGPDLQTCQAMVPEQYAKFFKFTGLQKDVESIIDIFDIGVLLTDTKNHGEGISNAILEYMALGKPTIATRGGGTNEAVDDGKTGILIEPYDPESLHEKLIYLLNASEVRKEMGQAAKNRMETLFGLERMTEAYYRLYERLL